MDRKDNSSVVASSLAAVIRQSLNAPFRRECLLLLGVTNIRDAEEKINELLKFREMEKSHSRKDKDMQEPVVIERSQQNTEQILVKSPKHTFTEAPISTASCSATNPSATVKTTLSAVIEGTCLYENISTLPSDSDDESQLDWDLEPERAN